MSTSGTGAEPVKYTYEQYMDECPHNRWHDGHCLICAADYIEIVNRLQSRLDSALQACTKVLEHVEELEDAWRRGIISEHDNGGGTRSNRNVGVRVQLRAILEVSP